MRRPRHVAPCTALLVALIAASACTPHKPTRSGFLGDYTAVNTAAPVAATYTRAIIEPVAFRPTGRTPKTVDPAVVAELTAAYQAALQTAFATRYTLVSRTAPDGKPDALPDTLRDTQPDAPPDTLRVRAAITGFTLANPALNTAALVVPLPLPSANGGISAEAEVLDARTGTRLATQSRAFNGNLFNSGPFAGFSPLAHARAGFRKISTDLLAEIAPPTP